MPQPYFPSCINPEGPRESCFCKRIGGPVVNQGKFQLLRKIGRLFVIKTRFEAYLIIFALALGAMTRGAHYTLEYPGLGGKLLFAATAGAVFLGGAKILDALRYERAARQSQAASGEARKD